MFIPVWILEVTLALLLFASANSMAAADLDHSLRVRLTYFGVIFGIFSLVVLLSIFIVIRLDVVVTWSWAIVLIPYWILEVICLLYLIASVAPVVRGYEKDQHFYRLIVIYDKFKWWPCRVLFAIFLVLQIDGVVSWNWAIVWLPLYGGTFLIFALDIAYAIVRLRRSTSIEETQALRVHLSLKLILLIFVIGLLAIFLGLLIASEDGTSPRSLAVIFVPLFVLLGIFFLCCCCCMPCVILLGPKDAYMSEDGELLNVLRRFFLYDVHQRLVTD